MNRSERRHYDQSHPVFDPGLPAVLTRSEAGINLHIPDEHVTIGIVDGETAADVLREVNATLAENYTECEQQFDRVADTVSLDAATWRFMTRPYYLDGTAPVGYAATSGLEMIMLANPTITLLHVVAFDVPACIVYRRSPTISAG